MKRLYIKQKVFKITDHYPVLDENQNVVYQVDQDFKLIGNTVHVSDKHGSKIFVVDKEIFTLLPKYVVNFANGQSIYLVSRLRFLVKQIDVLPEETGIVLEGDIFDHNFSIYKHGSLIAMIQKQFLAWGDTYELIIHDEKQQDLILSLMIAVDCIKDAQARRR
jgi:uncharacterized protein YxjI